jgi:dTDP-4-dehydrorhamnose 3,5-epimerase
MAYHKVQTDSFIVVKGMMKVVLYDGRNDSKTFDEINEYFLGEHNNILLLIPNYVYHGFKCISECEAICINLPSETYKYNKPDEYRV